MGIISILPYDDGLEQLAKLAVRRELIPFFGAGFTAGCPACEGAVPNSNLAMSSMQKLILQSTSELTAEDLEILDFYTLPDLFFQYVSSDERAKYFEQNYTDVTIFKNQKDHS